MYFAIRSKILYCIDQLVMDAHPKWPNEWPFSTHAIPITRCGVRVRALSSTFHVHVSLCWCGPLVFTCCPLHKTLAFVCGASKSIIVSRISTATAASAAATAGGHMTRRLRTAATLHNCVRTSGSVRPVGQSTIPTQSRL